MSELKVRFPKELHMYQAWCIVKRPIECYNRCSGYFVVWIHQKTFLFARYIKSNFSNLKNLIFFWKYNFLRLSKFWSVTGKTSGFESIDAIKGLKLRIRKQNATKRPSRLFLNSETQVVFQNLQESFFKAVMGVLKTFGLDFRRKDLRWPNFIQLDELLLKVCLFWWNYPFRLF